MGLKRFFNKRINILLFVTIIFGVIGTIVTLIVPNMLFEQQIDNIEADLHELTTTYESIDEIGSSQVLYIYKDGESQMITPTGEIRDINYEVEHHLIHWSVEQEVETLLYRDDFQMKQYVYYIYVVAEDHYVVAFADTQEVYTFVSNFRLFSMISVVLLYIIAVGFSLTIFSNSLVRKYSLYDPVTSLNTKASLLKRFKQKDLSEYHICYQNVVNLEEVIDASGPSNIDTVLKIISSNILKHFTVDQVYQLSNKEYIIITSLDNSAYDFEAFLNEDLEMGNLKVPLQFKTKQVLTNSELLKDTKITHLLKQFIYAFSRIKSLKNDTITIDEQLIEELKQESYYLSKLETAMKNGDITNFYQPKVNPINNQIIGAEALSRWKTEGEIISPAQYIYLAESNGLIEDVDLLSLRNSLRFIKTLQSKTTINEPFRVSTNFSPITLRNISFDQIKSVFDEESVDPKYISIEVTESSMLEYDIINNLISEMANFGLQIEIDDFSAGNSSFTMLSLLNANVVKLDRAILPKDEQDNREKLIYQSLVDVSKKLGLKIISEGVELNHQKSFVQELGVEGIQGYIYSKPLDIDTFIEYYINNPK